MRPYRERTFVLPPPPPRLRKIAFLPPPPFSLSLSQSSIHALFVIPAFWKSQSPPLGEGGEINSSLRAEHKGPPFHLFCAVRDSGIIVVPLIFNAIPISKGRTFFPARTIFSGKSPCPMTRQKSDGVRPSQGRRL